MKRSLLFLTGFCLCLTLFGCGSSDVQQVGSAVDSEDTSLSSSATIGSPEEGIDLDLTKLSSTMVYSEVYNLLVDPDGYRGKVVRMKGTFSVYHDEETGKNYFACLIADATACCSQGIEFERDGEFVYPADYPEIGTPITVTGVLTTYEEEAQRYCQLSQAKMTVTG